MPFYTITRISPNITLNIDAFVVNATAIEEGLRLRQILYRIREHHYEALVTIGVQDRDGATHRLWTGDLFTATPFPDLVERRPIPEPLYVRIFHTGPERTAAFAVLRYQFYRLEGEGYFDRPLAGDYLVRQRVTLIDSNDIRHVLAQGDVFRMEDSLFAGRPSAGMSLGSTLGVIPTPPAPSPIAPEHTHILIRLTDSGGSYVIPRQAFEHAMTTDNVVLINGVLYQARSEILFFTNDGRTLSLEMGSHFIAQPIDPLSVDGIQVQLEAVDRVCEDVRLSPLQRALIRTIVNTMSGYSISPGDTFAATITVGHSEISGIGLEGVLTSELPRPLGVSEHAPIRSRYEILGDEPLL